MVELVTKSDLTRALDTMARRLTIRLGAIWAAGIALLVIQKLS